MEFTSITDYRMIFWKGDLDDNQMILQVFKNNSSMEPLNYRG